MTLTGDCSSLTHPLAPTITLKNHESDGETPGAVLFVGGFSLLNILQNLLQSQRFDVIESQSPTVARVAVLLRLISCPAIALQDRMEMFMEVYGNTKLRERTVHALDEHILPQLISDLYEEPSKQKHGMPLDFSQLKHREKDDVETALKFFRSTCKQPFDIDKLMRYRNIKHLGVRYDHFENSIDYDYHMKLHDLAPIIHKSEYFKWRQDGLAFTVRDADYSVPNRTLATVDVMLQNGLSTVKWGYFSDILSSPFIGLGIRSDNQEFFQKRNEVFVHCSQDVFSYNLRQILDGILGNDEVQTAIDNDNNKWKAFVVRFLPCNVESILSKARFHGRYANAVLSASFAHHLPIVARCLSRHNGRLNIESVKYFLELNMDHKTAYCKRISQMAQESGLQPAESTAYDVANDYLTFHSVSSEE